MKKFVVLSVMGMFACGALFVNANNAGITINSTVAMNDSTATDSTKCDPAKNDTCKKELAMIVSGSNARTLTNDAMSTDSVATDTTKTEPAKAENSLLLAMSR